MLAAQRARTSPALAVSQASDSTTAWLATRRIAKNRGRAAQRQNLGGLFGASWGPPLPSEAVLDPS
eukprot:3377474-Pyramimonas_sp.AAC.1